MMYFYVNVLYYQHYLHNYATYIVYYFLNLIMHSIILGFLYEEATLKHLCTEQQNPKLEL